MIKPIKTTLLKWGEIQKFKMNKYFPEIEGNLDLGNSIEVAAARELAMMEPITTTPNHQITNCIPCDGDDDDDDDDE